MISKLTFKLKKLIKKIWVLLNFDIYYYFAIDFIILNLSILILDSSSETWKIRKIE